MPTVSTEIYNYTVFYTVKQCILTTGVREIGGLTVMQAMEIVRGCKGLNVVGGDVVEVGI